MLTTAKIFKNGNSQAVRLPKTLHLEGDEVWISKNEATGEIKLTPKKSGQQIWARYSSCSKKPKCQRISWLSGIISLNIRAFP
jgi:virulence-associated protein VagC